jgi:hypothetical protein
MLPVHAPLFLPSHAPLQDILDRQSLAALSHQVSCIDLVQWVTKVYVCNKVCI